VLQASARELDAKAGAALAAVRARAEAQPPGSLAEEHAWNDVARLTAGVGALTVASLDRINELAEKQQKAMDELARHIEVSDANHPRREDVDAMIVLRQLWREPR
jgi:hypothetical protein